jgi:DNA-binding NtrC family response regulator
MDSDQRTLLIVDDNRYLLESLEHGFRARGYEVLLAKDGNVALALLAEHRVDCVFLDIIIAGKEGFETLREIRELYPSLPVYVMSGGGTHRGADFLSMMMKIGATGTIAKPATCSQIAEIIEGATGRGTS